MIHDFDLIVQYFGVRLTVHVCGLKSLARSAGQKSYPRRSVRRTVGPIQTLSSIVAAANDADQLSTPRSLLCQVSIGLGEAARLELKVTRNAPQICSR